jgi:hypothetical protein
MRDVSIVKGHTSLNITEVTNVITQHTLKLNKTVGNERQAESKILKLNK